MVVKSQIKFIKSLQQKKCRIEHGMFVAEGIKIVRELLEGHFKEQIIYTLDRDLLGGPVDKVQLISESDLKKISGLITPNKVLGVFHIPQLLAVDFTDWVVVLDGIKDPGNLGTIIRLCDWFGIRHLVCSTDTVDCYNPKVLQATMGSIARVNVVYTEIERLLEENRLPVYGAFMDGLTASKEQLPNEGILIMGNEAHGISNKVKALIEKKISIPQFGEKTVESLNVATATAILLDEIRRI